MPSLTCFRGIIPAVNVARRGLQWAREHEGLEASSVVFAVVSQPLPGVLRRAQHWWQGSCYARAGRML